MSKQGPPYSGIKANPCATSPYTGTISRKGPSPRATSALSFYHFGLAVIPVVEGKKYPYVPHDPWLKELNEETITRYWAQHPNADVGCILGDSYIVFDCDSEQAEQAMTAIEERFGIQASLVIKTPRGSHRYYRIAEGAYAKSDSHSTEAFPGGIDVRHGRGMAVLVSVDGRKLVRMDFSHASEIQEVSQEFIDAVFVHNGRPPPRPLQATVHQAALGGTPIPVLSELLAYIDPGSGYEDWLHVLMAIFHETGGSDDGLELADGWSSKGANYAGRKDVEVKWRSFTSGHSRPVTVASLIYMAREAGADVGAIMNRCEEFELCDTVVIGSPTPNAPTIALPSAVEPQAVPRTVLAAFSMLGMSQELERLAQDQKPILGNLVLRGQAVAIFAWPNAGKTLIILSLVMEAVRSGAIHPASVYFINMDDNAAGLRDKLLLAEEFGFQMLADGYFDFDAQAFNDSLVRMIETDTAHGVVVILDTLKKFVNVMDKGRSAAFGRLVRRFVMKGGTVVALAHANKHPNPQGKVTYGGTSDIVDDFDCAYILDVLTSDADSSTRTVEFTNIKRRGNVDQTAAYTYTLDRDISYAQLLASVAPVGPAQVIPLRAAIEAEADSTVIAAVLSCLADGIDTKMQLAGAASQRVGVSRRKAMAVIEKYTGNDPQHHRWRYVVKARGAQVFQALEPEPIPPQV